MNVMPTAVEHALKRVVRLINCDFFGKRRANKGWTIAHAVTSDSGRYGDHPHAHLLLAAPDGVSDEQLCAVVERAVQRTALVSRQRHYGQYFSLGGAEYLVKHGPCPRGKFSTDEATHEVKDQVWGLCAKHGAAVRSAGHGER